MSDFSFARDDQGREVLVGLSVEETEFCSLHRHKLLLKEYLTEEEKVRYLDLMARHDQHRLHIINELAEKKKRGEPS
jgi:hypothetical protein